MRRLFCVIYFLKLHKMQPVPSFILFNPEAALRVNRLLPVKTDVSGLPATCRNCKYVNRANYNYCTNCGFPIHPDQLNLALFNRRLQQKEQLKRQSLTKIAYARNALYLLAAFSMFGIVSIFSGYKAAVVKGFVMVVLGVIYAGLGRWSVRKPFTALLISLIIILSFVAINTWAEFTSKTVSSHGALLFALQLVLVYILLQGVKGAFHADILEEDVKS